MYRDYDQFVSILEQCNGQLAVRKAVTGINQLDNIRLSRIEIDTISTYNSFIRLLNQQLSSLYDIHAYQTLDIYPEFDDLKNIDTTNMAPKAPPKVPQTREDMMLLGNPLYINHEYYLPYIYTFITIDSDTLIFQYPKIVAYNGIPFTEYVKDNLNKFHFSGTFWDYEKKEYGSNYSLIPYYGLLTIEENGKEETINLITSAARCCLLQNSKTPTLCKLKDFKLIIMSNILKKIVFCIYTLARWLEMTAFALLLSVWEINLFLKS